MDNTIRNRHLWRIVIVSIAIDIILLVPLFFEFQRIPAQFSSGSIIIASMVFWGVRTIGLAYFCWETYYQYIYYDWMFWILPGRVLIYSIVGVGLWWLAQRLHGSTLLWLVLLGGIGGVLKYIFGIYGLGILEKVPWLQEVTPFPLLVFSFFEYVFYWTLVAWLALRIGQYIL
jgi:hypothetical protein